MTAPDFYFDGVGQTRLDSWPRGRVLVVGDAAYGPSLSTGQGTSLALIGAYELAQALADEATPAAVGARYERLRPFIERNQAEALNAAQTFAPMTTLGAWFRNFNLRILPYLPWRDWVIAMMMRAIERAAKAHTLDAAADAPTAASADHERQSLNYAARSPR